MVDRKSSQTKTFSQNMFYMFCLYHFSLKCIIKNSYLLQDDLLKRDFAEYISQMAKHCKFSIHLTIISTWTCISTKNFIKMRNSPMIHRLGQHKPLLLSHPINFDIKMNAMGTIFFIEIIFFYYMGNKMLCHNIQRKIHLAQNGKIWDRLPP